MVEGAEKLEKTCAMSARARETTDPAGLSTLTLFCGSEPAK